MSVEARWFAGAVIVRDSKDPAGPLLAFNPQEWDGGRGMAFTPVTNVPAKLASVSAQRHLDAWQQAGEPTAPGAWYALADDNSNKLYFDQGEVDAFRKGVAEGKFLLGK
jgi:hypothetical protein